MGSLRLPVRAALSLIILATTAATSFAQWPQGYSIAVGGDGTRLGVVNGFCLPGEGPGDFYAVFGAWSGTGRAVWQAAHLTTDAQSLWSSPDAQGPLPGGTSLWDDAPLAPTGVGGFVNALSLQGSGVPDMRAAVGDPSGAISPPWPYSDIGASPSAAYVPSCCRADDGGVFVAWTGADYRLHVQHLDASGAVAPGWPSGGLRPAIGSEGNLGTAPDGAGGVLVLVGYSSGSARIWRFAADTTLAPGWPALGLFLTTDYIMYPVRGPMRVLQLDSTHFFALWTDYSSDLLSIRLKCQRFSLDGSVDPAWPAQGIQLATGFTDPPANLTCVEDGAGGVTVGWSQGTQYLACHIRADGTMPGLFAGGPLVMFDLPSGNLGYVTAGLARGIGGGSCIFAFDGTGIFGWWFDGDGNALGCDDPGDDCRVEILPFSDYDLAVPAAMPDGNGGAYVLYSRWTGQYESTHYVTHTHFLGDPTASVPVASRNSLALAVSPNPSRGPVQARLTLPDATPARLELVDLAGRRVLVRDVSGAGSHVERLAGSEPLAPGVYLVRLIDAGQTRAARAVVLH